MNHQVEEDSFYHSLGEEASDVDCLLVEPRSDQVSVSGVWCYEEDNRAKCIKTENAPYNLGVPDSNRNMEGVDVTIRNAFDVLPHEVGVNNLLTTNVSHSDDYLLDIGFDHGAFIGYVSNEGLHTRNTQFPMKGSFDVQNSLTENILGIEYQNYLLSNCIFGTSTNSSEPKGLDRFEDFSNSFVDQENNNQDILLPQFSQNEMEVTPFCKDGPTSTSSVEDHGGVGELTHKRSRKPTKRYIDESSMLSLNNSKKRREASCGSRVKLSGVRRVKSQIEVKPKEKMLPAAVSFDKAIQVPFSSHVPTECQKSNSPAKVSKNALCISRKSFERVQIEKHIENYSSEPEDDSETMTRSVTGGNQRKHHRVWTVSEVKKLLDGVAHFGVGKWTHIKKSLFSSSAHRTPVDLKDKWRNLLKASHALKGSKTEDDQKRSQSWRPLPKSVLCRVRELASIYPYRQESSPKISKSKFQNNSSPGRVKSPV
ncbi:putative transcription factor MYB-HB-like family [Helianthus anomalus]